MYWIEVRNDGSYLYEGQEHTLLSEGIVQQESCILEPTGDDWARIIVPFELETEHGVFTWDVEIIEYITLGVTSFLGMKITDFPAGVILKEEVRFRVQDGWAYPKGPTAARQDAAND